MSALLSAQGLGADVAAIEGRAGLFALYYGGSYVPEVLHAGLGTDFSLLGARFKPWPTSGTVHPFIEAGVELARRHRLTLAQIQQVVVRSGTYFTPWCEPLEERRCPQNAAAAANSVIFGVVKALVNGTVRLTDFTPQGLRQPEAMQIAARTSYEVDDRLGRSGVVVVTTTAGQRLEGRVDTSLGHPDRPLSDARLFRKFQDCAQYAAHPLAAGCLDELVTLVERLETVPDVAALTTLLASR